MRQKARIAKKVIDGKVAKEAKLVLTYKFVLGEVMPRNIDFPNLIVEIIFILRTEYDASAYNPHKKRP